MVLNVMNFQQNLKIHKAKHDRKGKRNIPDFVLMKI